MRIVIVIEGKGIADESSKAIEQECKKCGKTFRNVGYAYCSKDCELMDNWNYIEIWKYWSLIMWTYTTLPANLNY